MRRRLAALALLASLTGGPARADYRAIPRQWDMHGTPIRVLGWSQDGGSLVLTREVEYFPMETAGQAGLAPMKLVFGVVRDVRNGREQRYVLELVGEQGPTMRPELAKLPGPKEWKAWLDAHPLHNEGGRQSPDGRMRAVVAVQSGHGRGEWKGAAYEFRVAGAAKVYMELSLELDGARVGSFKWADEEPPSTGRVTLSWSPDGKRVAWILDRDGSRGVRAYTQLRVLPAGPRVELVAPPKSDASLGDAYARLEAIGLYPGKLRNDARVPAETVIFAAPGYEAFAERAAAQLPGHARVETMTWPSMYDLTVQAAPSLLAPPAPPADAGPGESGEVKTTLVFPEAPDPGWSSGLAEFLVTLFGVVVAGGMAVWFLRWRRRKAQ